MDEKVRGIVVQSLRYGDTSLIVRVFTRNRGLQSYLVKGAFNRNAKNRVALFQSLNIIRYVEVGKPKPSTLAYLKDVQLDFVYQSLPNVVNKSAIMIFVSELLSKTLTGQERNEPLYDFIEHSLQWLDLMEEGFANFPVFFALELSRHLGFYPKTNYVEGSCFDMMEGSFVPDYPVHPYCFGPDEAQLFSRMLDVGIDEACRVPLNVVRRRELLDGIMTFMRLHAPVMTGFRSHEVLKSVLE